MLILFFIRIHELLTEHLKGLQKLCYSLAGNPAVQMLAVPPTFRCAIQHSIQPARLRMKPKIQGAFILYRQMTHVISSYSGVKQLSLAAVDLIHQFPFIYVLLATATSSSPIFPQQKRSQTNSSAQACETPFTFSSTQIRQTSSVFLCWSKEVRYKQEGCRPWPCKHLFTQFSSTSLSFQLPVSSHHDNQHASRSERFFETRWQCRLGAHEAVRMVQYALGSIKQR